MDATTTARAGRTARAAKLDALLAQARIRLIDTGTRNRLVHTNRRAKRPSTLAILSGEPDTLFGRLVHDGALLRFRSDPRIITSDDEEETVATASSASSLEPVISSRDILQTHVTEDTLQKRLLKFARDAKTLEEEQGINILYLAIGFLRWYEDDNSEVFREAPLILIPVSLVRDVRRSTFDLRGREEDISTNLPLAERLKDDFGITLPEVPDEDSWIPATYFGSVEGAVRNKPRWSIDRTAVELGFFSFAKLLMFHDLAGNAWPEDAILEHPLLRGLLMEGFESEIPLFQDDVKIDETFEPAELIQVVDADGSQTLSIEAVRAGRNLVIQGPPGTGKSQTIANIIASAVHDGKTVLFIAEKMVALEVVHARLAKAGLNTICLELHSRAANKRVVAEELGRTLSMGAAEPNLTKDAERLKLVRDQLNAFCRQLHSPIGETDMTPYKALGDLVSAAGRGLPPPEIRITGLETWDSGAYQRVENAGERLAVIFQRLGTNQAHPWTGTRTLNLQPPDLARLQDRLTKLRKVFQELAQLSASSATVIAQPAPATLASVRHLIELLDEVKSAPTANADTIRWLAGLGGYERQRALHIAEEGVVTQGVIKKSEGLFQPAALRADVASVRSSLARGVRSWFIRLLPNYRRATAELSAWLAGPLPAAASERVQIVELLANLQERVRILSNYAAEAESLLGPAWAAHRSDFHGIMLAGEWLERVTIRARKLDLNQALAWGARGEMAALLPKRLRNDFEAADVGLAALVEVLDLDVTSAFGVSAIETVPFDTLVERLAIWNGAIDRYNEWGELSRADAEIRDAGAGDLADHLADGRSSPDQAAAQLRYARAEALWKISIRRDPALAHPTGEARSTLVREFRQLETERRQAIAQLIRARHVSAIPRGAMGAMAVVRGEIARKRGHMPIRKLMQRAGRTIQSIKPVFMMSPISVAQYLPPGALTFDMVVIDEASQVRPEDALGVIARGPQIVVVGDRKQLPPTSFFSRLLADDEAEDDENPAAEVSQLAGAARVTELESILTLCEARGLPSRMLRWHYRSRHPSLVEVSNAEFYESSLFLPPAPVAHRDTEGFVVRRTHGAYDRGGKRTNPIEAKAVVDAVAAHAARQPKLSLGVATFSSVQRDLIANLLDEQRRADPVLDEFLKPGHEEVFVKNLENVQGDERDVIFVSVGYGPRQPGSRLDSMNFGPVSSEGGERRLNVLFTRARRRCEVFVSFDSGDIDLTRATGAGPRVFKRFLAYAETGVLDQPIVTAADYDSAFEEDIARVIQSMGYPVDAQVGSAGFRIDLGVRDPKNLGQYLLAVECDGATYHCALWARERDRLRQEILEGLGWRFHRIWSTDWFHRREAEVARLRNALEAARDAPHVPKSDTTPPSPVAQDSILLNAPPTIDRTPYRLADFQVGLSVEPHEVSVNRMAEIAGRIVEIEGPVHADEIARRVATLFGKDRAGSRITAAVLAGLRYRIRTVSAFCEEEGFWFTADQRDACPIRERSATSISLQRADMLPPLEIRAAAVQALKENGVIKRDEIATAITRMLGFQRTGPDLRSKIDEVTAKMLADKTLRDDSGFLQEP